MTLENLLSESKINVGTTELLIQDIESELNEFDGGIKCQYCGITLAKSEYSEKKKLELEQLKKDLKVHNKEVKTYSKEEEVFVDLKNQFDEYEKNKLVKEKCEIQIETFELKKGSIEDKLKRYREQEVKVTENNKIDEVLVKADMRLDELNREKG